MDVDRRVADLEGLPRKNGELVFAAPWQSRIFGMAVALNERGTYEWDDFRRRLVDEIARDPDRDYYGSWLGALERLLLDTRVLSDTELTRRKAEYANQLRDDFV
jgi:nitrile hydratase accessory protein